MPDVKAPADRPAHARRDKGAADMATQVAMGWVEEQAKPPPEPAPLPPVEDTPSPTEQANKTMLTAALTEAGVEEGTGDDTAIALLAKLPPDTVRAVTRWLKSPKKPTK